MSFKMDVSNKLDQSTLVLVQVVFRHGIRAPDHSYPGDPYEHVKYEPFGRGKLTKEGRKQAYDFGKDLRKRYNTFLGPEYYEELLESHSSEVGRAQMSLQLVLAGMFPPTETTKIEEGLNWQPITYNYKPLKEDPLLGSMIMQTINNKNHAGFKTSQDSIDLIQLVENKLGWSIKHFSELLLIFDTIRVQVDNGLAMPEWIGDAFEDKLVKEMQCYITENMERKNYLKIGVGGLINKIVDEIDSRVTNTGAIKPKMILYSGHDVNVGGLMKLLQFPGFVWPLYISSLTFELHCVDNEYYVKVVFIDGYVPKKEEIVPNLEQIILRTNDKEAWLLQDFKNHVDSSFDALS